jgi:hypothetical protein
MKTSMIRITHSQARLAQAMVDETNSSESHTEALQPTEIDVGDTQVDLLCSQSEPFLSPVISRSTPSLASFSSLVAGAWAQISATVLRSLSLIENPLIPDTLDNTPVDNLSSKVLTPIDSDSDDEIPNSLQNMSPLNHVAGEAYILQTSSKQPPSLMAGKITSELLHQWERACLNYFCIKAVQDEDRVPDILFELKDPLVDAWVCGNTDNLLLMTFPVFMEELRAKFLEHKWECKLRIKILRTPQGSLSFMEWIIQMQGMNAILFS